MKIATHNIEFLFEEGTHTHSGKEWNYTKELVEARIPTFNLQVQPMDKNF